MKKPSDYKKIVKLLTQLNNCYPTYNMGRHIATIIDGYGDIWGMSDSEFLFALERYKAELDYDIPHVDRDIEEIINEGLNIGKLRRELLEAEDEDDFDN